MFANEPVTGFCRGKLTGRRQTPDWLSYWQYGRIVSTFNADFCKIKTYYLKINTNINQIILYKQWFQIYIQMSFSWKKVVDKGNPKIVIWSTKMRESLENESITQNMNILQRFVTQKKNFKLIEKLLWKTQMRDFA